MKSELKVLLIFGIFFLNACATYKTQYKHLVVSEPFPKKELSHSFYLIGNAGLESKVLQDFKSEINKASKNSTVLFLGDNINSVEFTKASENQLKAQIDVVKDFKGNSIFMPGHTDWQSAGLIGLKSQEYFINNALKENTFLPKNGCPIEKVDLSNDIDLIIVDSEWYLTNWDKHPTINDNCDIKTRKMFFEKFERLIKEARGKTTIIAVHHPMFTNGPHGGQYSFMSHFKPFPVVGAFSNLIRKTAGLSTGDIQNKKYHAFKTQLVTLAQENEKIIFVSGHEQNLQYIAQDNVVQIISGSGSKSTETRNVNGEFSSGDLGFARLDVFKDGSSQVKFYSTKEAEVIFNTEIFSEEKSEYNTDFKAIQSQKTTSVYPKEDITKRKFHKYIWGERYRKYYGTEVTVPAVNLDTLFGGLKPISRDFQDNSLQLVDRVGKIYVMRALRKSPTAYLKKIAFKDQYIEGQFEGTDTESLLNDFNMGIHPYAPLVIPKLSDAVNLYHTNPVLYYVPKQKGLVRFNSGFGDALYVIEEQVHPSHSKHESFGNATKIVSTDEVMKQLQNDENYEVDTNMYIRARLFDMLIGDWDKATDKWRWAEFQLDDKVVYRPIPVDRDQAFSIMGDGALMNLGTRFLSQLKPMEGFNYRLRDIKGFNSNSFFLDLMLLNKTTLTQWEAQVALLKNNLTDEVIHNALKQFPKEVQDELIVEIKVVLKGRLNKLLNVANKYYKALNKTPLVVGTDKADWFDVERMPKGNTKLAIYRIENGKKGALIHEKLYRKRYTKDIWVYGLNGDDVFNVFGKGNNEIRLCLFGGQSKDTYNVESGKRVNVYDYKYKDNEFATNEGTVKLTDDYETNAYDYTKIKKTENEFMPTIGVNPDAGLNIGFVNTLTNYGVERNPFSSQHTISSSYYFATQGFDFEYNNEFANIDDNWNFGFNTKITSPSFAVNFFGYGNSTVNLNAEDRSQYKLDYNRVKLSTFKFSPALNWRGDLDAKFKLGLSFESVEVEKTLDRFINNFYASNGLNNQNNFVGAEATYSYLNYDKEAFPTLGMQVSLQAGFKANIKESRTFNYIIPEVGFTYKLIPSGQLVLATRAKGHVIFGEGFEFYQSANLGENNGLRGYRNERFSGKNAFYQSTDIRVNLYKVKTRIIPLNLGFYGGYDYGRVWVGDSLVLNADFNLNRWNTSIGGGFFANAADVLTLNMSVFNSSDGLRLAFKAGFGF